MNGLVGIRMCWRYV